MKQPRAVPAAREARGAQAIVPLCRVEAHEAPRLESVVRGRRGGGRRGRRRGHRRGEDEGARGDASGPAVCIGAVRAPFRGTVEDSQPKFPSMDLWINQAPA